MPPQPHRLRPCMEPCSPCEEKRICHTAAADEKQAETKTESPHTTFLWQPQNQNHHIKREKTTVYAVILDFAFLMLTQTKPTMVGVKIDRAAIVKLSGISRTLSKRLNPKGLSNKE
jgi:hypothetical protein